MIGIVREEPDKVKRVLMRSYEVREMAFQDPPSCPTKFN
jgi:hypothetical protein